MHLNYYITITSDECNIVSTIALAGFLLLQVTVAMMAIAVMTVVVVDIRGEEAEEAGLEAMVSLEDMVSRNVAED